MRVAHCFLAFAIAATTVGAAGAAEPDGDGLQASARPDRTSGRLSISTRTMLSWATGLAMESRLAGHGAGLTAVNVDYFFAPPREPGQSRGFRATGGIGFTRAGSALPYVNVGYSGIYPKSGWGFKADVGLAGGGSAADSGSVAAGLDSSQIANQQGVDTLYRQMRMRPLLQVGVSYSF